MDKIKILFVCLGNICRSPMAEFVMKDLVEKTGLTDRIYVSSAATSTEELGNPVYPPAKLKLYENGIVCTGKTARQMSKDDYNRYDLLIGMDASNIRNMKRICGGDPQNKIHLLMEYGSDLHDVADPWFTGNFDATWNDVLDGCTGLLNNIK